ncbi:MAG: ribonuclease III [Chloroflexota bacterium]
MVGFLTDEVRDRLEHDLSVKIKRPELFEQALLHRSYLQVLSKSEVKSNERLEFLGDAILGMIVGEYLFENHQNVPEGELTKMRSWLVNKNALSMAARRLELDHYLMMSFSANKSLREGHDSILADALEAIIAAIYLDSGLEAARLFIFSTLIPMLLDKSVMTDTNFKSSLLEKVQALGKPAPRYVVLQESGPDHDKKFLVGVFVLDELLGQGEGKSKKQAEQLAAKEALQSPIFKQQTNNE